MTRPAVKAPAVKTDFVTVELSFTRFSPLAILLWPVWPDWFWGTHLINTDDSVKRFGGGVKHFSQQVSGMYIRKYA
ncbi:MAG: hypothetical protein ACJAYI_001583 [Myxococcota bacterium]|jgi:hypothetical protein